MKLFKKYITVFLLLFVLTVGFWLRSNNDTTWPRLGATFDEFAWTWLGINLIQKHVPISWSSQPQYTNKHHLVYHGAAFWIVTPYLEHPPLFGLVAGSFALLNGVKDMYHVTIEKIRPLALLLGILSIGFVFLFASELYGKNIGFIAAFLYATIPTIVIGSRIVQNENFFIPLWLLALYNTLLYLKKNKRIFLYIAAVISGLLILAKVPWIVAGFSICLLLANKQKWKDAFLVGVVTIAIGSLFLLYGFYYDKTLFLSLWRLQLARYDISFIGLYSLFSKPLIVDRLYTDGWIYFGFFSILLLARDIKKHLFVLLPFLSYLFVYIFFIPDEPFHGWYRYPFYPFLILSIAVFLKEYFSKNQILTGLFFVFVGLPLFQSTWVQAFGFSYAIYRIVLLGFALPLVTLFIQNKQVFRITTFINYGWLGIFFLLNVWAVTLYNEQ